MRSNRKKILVAVDGSNHALDTVIYLSRTVPCDRAEVVLFGVLSTEPDWFLDNTYYSNAVRDPSIALDWRNRRKFAMENFMKDASRILAEQGFPSEAVRVKIEEKRVGIARDIILEAREGYHVVVVGRQGTNPITRLVLGSVASKLIQTITHIPLWMVGETEESQKILVAVDGSENAMRAVEHVGVVAAGGRSLLTLLHVVRGLEARAPVHDADASRPFAEAPLEETHVEETIVNRVLERACELLEKMGIGQDRISAKTITGVATRSGTIIVQAVNGGYGTIVMGRRGHSEVGEFHLGRVTNKVIQLAGTMAVWVVN